MESQEIKEKVYGYFESGYHCAEAITKSILEIFSNETQPGAMKTASGFGGGIGGSTEELCGAFTGGVIALSYLLGRESPKDSLTDCGTLIKEFKRKFLDEVGSINCPIILQDYTEQINPIGCVELTANAAVILADLLDEYGLSGEIAPNVYSDRSREMVKVGHCPFSATA